MKKIIIALLSIMMLAACGSNNEEEPTKEAKETTGEATENKADDDIYFDGETAQIEMLKVEIKETKVIPVGEEGNEYGDKPVFAIWYEATNFTDEDIDPNTAWFAIFEAVQDNSDDMVNELSVGMLPDEEHLDSQMNTIKKDGTVENSIAYELDDETTPITLIATQGVDGDEIGRQDYEIK